VEKAECSGIVKQKHLKEPQKFEGRRTRYSNCGSLGGGTYTRIRPTRYNNTTI
jgi:hypothetical protein